RLSGLDPMTGSERWHVDLGGPLTRGPAISGGTIYQGVDGVGLVALNERDRSIRWQISTGPGAVGTPAIAGRVVYFGRGLGDQHGAHDLVAVSAGDGRQLWSFSSPSGAQVHVGAVGESRTYSVAEDGAVRALDSADGSVLWTFQTGGSIGTFAGVADG